MYSRTKPTTYIVHWPAYNIVKVGYSDCQRWRIFLLRGAVIVDLVESETVKDALAMETVVQEWFAETCPPAFTAPSDAEPFLGCRGGGYLECYRLPDGATPMALLESIASKHASKHPEKQCDSSNARTYERNEQTYNLLTLRENLALGNARRGVARFDPPWNENRRPACAARGLEAVTR